MRERSAYKVLEGKPEGQIPLKRPKRRWEDNIKMHLQESGREPWPELIWLKRGIVGGLL